jgi:hypothetical protein
VQRVVAIQGTWKVAPGHRVHQAVAAEKSEFHDRRNFQPAHPEHATSIVGMEVDACVRLQEFVKRPTRDPKKGLAPEMIKVVEFDDDDPESSQQGIRRREKHLVLASLDIDLKEQVRVASRQRCRHPIIQRHEVVVRRRPDEFLREGE